MEFERKGAVLYALMQAGFVVLGVVLALLGNEWRNNAQDAERARIAAASIIEELRVNREAASASLEYHRDVLEKMSARTAASPPLGVRDFPKGFVFAARLNRTAWDAASDIGALSHLPYERVLDLSRMYSLQQRYEEQARSVGQLFYGEVLQNGVESIPQNAANLASIIAMFIHRETELVALYDVQLQTAASGS
jgi:hypothetical protein